jgi:hypothetical protein
MVVRDDRPDFGRGRPERLAWIDMPGKRARNGKQALDEGGGYLRHGVKSSSAPAQSGLPIPLGRAGR